jgi:predicted SprT family Zn-dependent metalloprotease
MKPRTVKAQRQRVQRVLDAWIEPLGLKWYRTEVLYYTKSRQFKRHVVARVFCDWRYMTAQIRVNLSLIEHLTDDAVEHCLVHELAHMLLAEAEGIGNDSDHLERAVETVTKALLWTRSYARERRC